MFLTDSDKPLKHFSSTPRGTVWALISVFSIHIFLWLKWRKSGSQVQSLFTSSQTDAVFPSVRLFISIISELAWGVCALLQLLVHNISAAYWFARSKTGDSSVTNKPPVDAGMGMNGKQPVKRRKHHHFWSCLPRVRDSRANVSVWASVSVHVGGAAAQAESPSSTWNLCLCRNSNTDVGHSARRCSRSPLASHWLWLMIG